ncbi:hypothetical protein CYJ57_03135 [Falseniella ignava]|uniref:Uncharacterized protein n=1 Tax=Falseniella ignava TaxID=137730 RepID=A0A2I1K284_9LACT|nr:hypothetical protein [Falseniella ignava]PKY89717.1 hypothetical protein CYJ57_03135 [Falseniella ignava]
MNEEINKLIEEFEARLKEVKDKYEKIKPKLGYTETYWYIHNDGRVFSDFWGDTQPEHNIFAIGNVFKTKEEAEFEVERRKVLHELSMMGRPFKENAKNWVVSLDIDNNISATYSVFSRFVYGDYYFDTENEALEYVEKIGADRIKKYLFGIEE